MLVLLAVVALVPLLYLPGFLLARALPAAAQPADRLEQHYERVVAGALLNGWLAFTLAELGLFLLWLHLLLVLLVCAVAAVWQRGSRRSPLPPPPAAGARTAKSAKDRVLSAESNVLSAENVSRVSPLTSPLSRLPSHVSPLTSPLSRLPSRISSLAARGSWFSVLGSWFSWHGVALAGILALFATLASPPFEVVLGARDAGVYANTGFAIARSGAIVQRDALLAQLGRDLAAEDATLRAAAAQASTNFLGVQHPHRMIATRLRAAGFFIHEGDLQAGRVVPQFFHLYPAWIGLLAALLGFQGGLLATGLMGLLGVWSVAMLGRRLAGPAVGLLAALLLAINGVQVWFSRYSTSETTVQFLCFAGLYCFMIFSQAGNPAPAASAARARFAALLAGLAFGQLALTRIDFVLAIGPLLAYLGYRWLARRWDRAHTLLAAGLGVMLLQAALHVALIARAYFFDTLFARLQDFAFSALISMPFLTPALRHYYLTRPGTVVGTRPAPGVAVWNVERIGLELLAVAALIGGVLALRRYGQGPIAAVEGALRARARPLLLAVAIGIALLATYAYLARPRILTPALLAAAPSCLAPTQLRQPTGACLALQGYVGAPIAIPTDLRPVYAIPLANMVRVGWYLSPLGVALGVAGFALWWRRLDRGAWLFLTIALLAGIFFIRQTYGTSDQHYIYILRRYVPLVYPAFSLGIAYALIALAGAGFRARWRTLLAALLGGGLIAFMLVTNRPIYRHVEYEGALMQLGAIAARFGPRDVLLFRSGGRDEPDLMVTPLIYAYGVNAFTIKSDDPGRYAEPLARYIEHWQAQGRQVYLALGPGGGIGLPGLRLDRAGNLALRLPEFEQLPDQKPRNVQQFALDFTLYRLGPAPPTPAPPPHTVAVDDYATQARGFYRPEYLEPHTLAWTDGDAVLRLPWDGAARRLAVTLAGGKRPPTLGPPRACLSFRAEASFALDLNAPFVPLGCFTLAEAPREVVLALDERAAGPSATGTILLRIQSEPWVPAQADPALGDPRRLGVLFGGLRFETP